MGRDEPENVHRAEDCGREPVQHRDLWRYGLGKTTMLNALSKMIDPGERVLTIEDAAELRLQQPHWLPLETRPPNLEGQGAITIGDLVKNALRMRPDRIILGEVRGGEAATFLGAINTGHEGSFTTLHAASGRKAMDKMALLVMNTGTQLNYGEILRYLRGSIDAVIQTGREGEARGIMEVYFPALDADLI